VNITITPTSKALKDSNRKMLAAVYKGKQDLQMLQVARPLITDLHDAIVRVTASTVCGSDLHKASSGWSATTYPQIVGHEIIGKVTEVGPEVKTLKVGDLVGVGAQCGSCNWLPEERKGDECDVCPKGRENICAQMVPTYGGPYPDGNVSQGGYADNIRLSEHFAFKLPQKLKAESAGPLLCAGVTVYAPLVRCGVKNGIKVGVVGIGGLGHLGIQFASALGGEVTAISHSTHKKDDALKLGAKHFIATSDKQQLKEHAREFDVILCTANGGDNTYKEWISLMKPRGKFAMVGIPDGATLPLPIMSLCAVEGEFVGSMIGPPEVIKEMLEFAAEHNIEPWIETLPMSEATKALQKLHDGQVRYRIVLKN